MPPLRFRTLVGVALVLGSVAPMLTLAAVELDAGTRLAESTATARLNGIGAAQAARLATYVEANQEQVLLLSTRTQLRESLDEFLATGDLSARQRVREILLDALAASDDLRRLDVYGREGTVVASTDPMVEDTRGRPESFQAGQAGTRLDLFYVDEEEVRLDLVAPLLLDGRAIGVMVASVYPSALFGIADASGHPGLGQTGETIVALPTEAGGAVYVTPLRFDPEAALTRRVVADGADTAVLQAAHGEVGFSSRLVDYRGEEVMVSVHRVGDPPWGIAVKQDVSEVLEPVQQMRARILAAAGVVAAVAVALAMVLTKTVAGPVRVIHAATHRTKEGKAPATPHTGIDEFEDILQTLAEMTREVDRVQAGLERAVAERTAQLEASNSRLTQFTSAISHDIREPLLVMQLSVRRLRHALPAAGPEVMRRLEDLDGALRSASAMVESMLEWTRGTARVAAQEEQDADLELALEAALRDLQARIDESHARIVTDLLPTVRGSPEQLKLVLQNLIGNAIKYGGEPPLVHVRAKEQDGTWRIEVQDNGPGIPEEDRERVFSPFQQLEGRAKEGVGLGLSMCRRVIESHGGKISVEDGPGGGSVFWFTLPAAEPREDRPA